MQFRTAFLYFSLFDIVLFKNSFGLLFRHFLKDNGLMIKREMPALSQIFVRLCAIFVLIDFRRCAKQHLTGCIRSAPFLLRKNSARATPNSLSRISYTTLR
jgi:hypothetical protein